MSMAGSTLPVNAGESKVDRSITDCTIALVGNANVGKSSIFNQLTGLTQETGNWGGKTVDMAEGVLSHHGLKIKIIDLPGIYSGMVKTHSLGSTVFMEAFSLQDKSPGLSHPW